MWKPEVLLSKQIRRTDGGRASRRGFTLGLGPGRRSRACGYLSPRPRCRLWHEGTFRFGPMPSSSIRIFQKKRVRSGDIAACSLLGAWALLLRVPFHLAALAADLDEQERLLMLDGSKSPSAATASGGDFLAEGSHNVSLGGDFSIQVLQKALEVWELQVIPLDSPAAGSSLFEREQEVAFICHLQDHWFCIRKVNGEWYNFDSLYPAPEHLSKICPSAFIDTLKGSGCSIFAVRSNFPKKRSMGTEDSNDFGQWLTPDDA